MECARTPLQCCPRRTPVSDGVPHVDGGRAFGAQVSGVTEFRGSCNESMRSQSAGLNLKADGRLDSALGGGLFAAFELWKGVRQPSPHPLQPEIVERLRDTFERALAPVDSLVVR